MTLTPEQVKNNLNATSFASPLIHLWYPGGTVFSCTTQDEWWRAPEGHEYTTESFPNRLDLWGNAEQDVAMMAEAAWHARNQSERVADVMTLFVSQHTEQLAEQFFSTVNCEEWVNKVWPEISHQHTIHDNVIEMLNTDFPNWLPWRYDKAKEKTITFLSLAGEELQFSRELYLKLEAEFSTWCTPFLLNLMRWKAPIDKMNGDRINDNDDDDNGNHATP